MAENKLQEIIETLKKQGLESAEKESEVIIREAQKKADEIVAKAQADAKDIVERAEGRADMRLKQLKSAMEITASQFTTNLKQNIEHNFLTIPLKKALSESLNETDYLKSLLTTLVTEFTRNPTHKDIEVLLPKDQHEKLVDFAVGLIKSHAEDKGDDKLGLMIKSNGVGCGLRINKEEGDVSLDFTDEAFLELFLKFLAPKFRDYFRDIKLGES